MKNYQSIILSFIGLSFVLTACGQEQTTINSNSDVPNHLVWDTLLQNNVSDIGLVDYRAFIKDSTKLNQYLFGLSTSAPNDTWDESDQLAYWINLYNASTIKLVIQHYPIQSIKNIGSSIQIPFVNTPWQKEFIIVLDETLDLDNIEHNTIRKQFDEPRIHFALVCAAMSCPKLRNEAYQGGKLDNQLTDQAKVFLSDKNKNNISSNDIEISKLFKWYGGDFKKKGTLIEFLNQYSNTLISSDADIKYMDYDWGLNVEK
jgi:hypothetical protein